MARRTSHRRRTREGRRILIALLVSILLHLCIMTGIGIVQLLHPSPPPPPPPEQPPVEITIVSPEPPKKQQPSYIDTTEKQRVAEPTKDAPFESDKNTAAASELPAAGQAPVPTMEGEKAPGLEFENRNYTAGRQPREATPPAPPPQPAQPAAAQASAQPPTRQPQQKPTPRQTDALALLEPTPAKETPRPKQTEQTQQQQQTPTRPTQPSTPSTPGFQPQTRITRIQGNISNRGHASVAANATPLGRYKKMLSDAIGSRWYYYVNEQMSLLSVGSVQLSFVVNADGKAQQVKVISNTSNETFAACSVSAIMEAEIPPIPKELLPMLQGGRIEIEYTFTILN